MKHIIVYTNVMVGNAWMDVNVRKQVRRKINNRVLESTTSVI